MQGLILAAGRGSRLGEKTTEVPKCLLEVGRRPLVQHQLETLSDAGVGPVAMVVGYCADEIREVVGIRAEYITNARWNFTNSLYSFSLAREWISGPVLILNSDILFHPDVIRRLLKHGNDCFAYDSSSGHGGEHMKVDLEGAKLLGMSKDLEPGDVSGENVGVLCFTGETVTKLLDRADEFLKDGAGESKWLGAAVNSLAKEVPLEGVDIAGLPWGEIDFSYDLVHVRKDVWPAIKRDIEKRKGSWRIFRWTAAVVLTVFMAYLIYHAWISPREYVLATMDLASVENFKISSVEGYTKTWSRLPLDQTSEVSVVGPSHLLIDTRLLGKKLEVERPLSYVLEFLVDGRREGWYLKEAGISKGWTCPNYAVGKRERLRLDVPAGPHTVGLRLVAADSDSCLIRVRTKEIDDTID